MATADDGELGRRALLRGVGALAGLGVMPGCEREQASKPPESPPGEPQPAPTADAPVAGEASMRALQIDDYIGELNELALRPLAIPEAGDREVIVAVKAVALNPVDVAIARGGLKRFVPLKFPAILGWDLAGDVAGVGAGVEGYAVGDAVYAGLGYLGGAFASYARVPVDSLAHAPKRLSPAQQAALPLVSCTTVQAMAKVSFAKGAKVLVLGGAGGVGSTAVQWLVHNGAGRVVATASETKLETVRKLGAEVIDYRNDDWSAKLAGADFDIVYDTVGDDNAPTRATKVMRDGGHYLAIAGNIGDTAALGDKYHFEFFATRPSGADLATVTAAVDAGGITPLLFKEFAFEQIVDAYTLTAERVAVGKIVATL
ncbi:MAG: NADP-dependent oxidoreductase [Myxococcota bacterium]